jgi:hypothetical protein
MAGTHEGNIKSQGARSVARLLRLSNRPVAVPKPNGHQKHAIGCRRGLACRCGFVTAEHRRELLDRHKARQKPRISLAAALLTIAALCGQSNAQNCATYPTPDCLAAYPVGAYVIAATPDDQVGVYSNVTGQLVGVLWPQGSPVPTPTASATATPTMTPTSTPSPTPAPVALIQLNKKAATIVSFSMNGVAWHCSGKLKAWTCQPS